MSQAGRYTPSNFPGGFVQTLTADVGGPVPPTAGNINVFGGSNINTSGNPGTSTITVNLDNTIHWPDTNAAGTTGVIYLNNVPYFHNYGSGLGDSNTFLGGNAGNFTMTPGIAVLNTGIGHLALNSLTTGSANTSVGEFSLKSCTTGVENDAFGHRCLQDITTGSHNCAFGSELFTTLVTGSFNIGLGQVASAYTGAESSNILIGASGTLAESNVIHIGTQGAGNQEQNACYIAGIYNTAIGTPDQVVFIDSVGKLGSKTGTDGQVIIGSTAGSPAFANLTAGANITITNASNAITIAANATSVTYNYTSVNFAASPYLVLVTDYYIACDLTGGAITILLPNAPATGRAFVIKDQLGLANISNITVRSVSGLVNIDGATSYVMNTQYAAINLLFDSVAYQVY